MVTLVIHKTRRGRTKYSLRLDPQGAFLGSFWSKKNALREQLEWNKWLRERNAA